MISYESIFFSWSRLNFLQKARWKPRRGSAKFVLVRRRLRGSFLGGVFLGGLKMTWGLSHSGWWFGSRLKRHLWTFGCMLEHIFFGRIRFPTDEFVSISIFQRGRYTWPYPDISPTLYTHLAWRWKSENGFAKDALSPFINLFPKYWDRIAPDTSWMVLRNVSPSAEKGGARSETLEHGWFGGTLPSLWRNPSHFTLESLFDILEYWYWSGVYIIRLSST